MFTYHQDLYEMQMEGSVHSASVVMPIVLDILPARSVCDVGCGVGIWPRAFVRCGISDLRGLVGDCVDREILRIPASRFQAV